MSKSRRLIVAATSIAAALTAATLVGGSPARAAGGCVPLRAAGSGQDHFNLTTTASISVAGVTIGSTAASLVPTDQTGTVLSFTSPIVFTPIVGHGSFTVTTSGTVDLVTGAFQSSGQISDGTGLLRGVGGNLSFHGVEDLTTGRFTETIDGRLCGS